MSESKSKNDSWWADWLEQQRVTLGQAGAKSPGTQSSEDPWSKLIEFYAQISKGAPGETTKSQFAPFAFGEELIELWRNGWSTADVTRKAAASSMTDLIGRMPALGPAREQTQLWRDLASAQSECHSLEQELRAALLKVHADALAMMEQRLRAGATPETQSFRDLYNLWVRCAEEIYSQLAHSDAFCKLQADLGNATLRLRAQQQKLIEQWLKQFDLPTRAEINSVHLQLKQMRERVTQLERVATAESRPVEKPAPVRAKAKRKGTKTSVTRE